MIVMVVVMLTIICIILIGYIVLNKNKKIDPCVCPNNVNKTVKLEDNEIDNLFDKHQAPDFETFDNVESQEEQPVSRFDGILLYNNKTFFGFGEKGRDEYLKSKDIFSIDRDNEFIPIKNEKFQTHLNKINPKLQLMPEEELNEIKKIKTVKNILGSLDDFFSENLYKIINNGINLFAILEITSHKKKKSIKNECNYEHYDMSNDIFYISYIEENNDNQIYQNFLMNKRFEIIGIKVAGEILDTFAKYLLYETYDLKIDIYHVYSVFRDIISVGFGMKNPDKICSIGDSLLKGNNDYQREYFLTNTEYIELFKNLEIFRKLEREKIDMKYGEDEPDDEGYTVEDVSSYDIENDGNDDSDYYDNGGDAYYTQEEFANVEKVSNEEFNNRYDESEILYEKYDDLLWLAPYNIELFNHVKNIYETEATNDEKKMYAELFFKDIKVKCENETSYGNGSKTLACVQLEIMNEGTVFGKKKEIPKLKETIKTLSKCRKDQRSFEKKSENHIINLAHSYIELLDDKLIGPLNICGPNSKMIPNIIKLILKPENFDLLCYNFYPLISNFIAILGSIDYQKIYEDILFGNNEFKNSLFKVDTADLKEYKDGLKKIFTNKFGSNYSINDDSQKLFKKVHKLATNLCSNGIDSDLYIKRANINKYHKKKNRRFGALRDGDSKKKKYKYLTLEFKI
jgi:hypothetical protein